MIYELSYSRENEQYRVIVTTKRIKNIIFRFRDRVFYVSAPFRTKDELIFDYLNRFYHRLLARHAKVADPFVDGQLYLLGRLVGLYEGEDIKGHFLVGEALYYKNKSDFDRKLRRFASEYLTSRVRVFETSMGIKKAYEVKIRQMKTRFGTNSRRTHSLTFQLKLIHFHPEIIDAIVVHELAHDRHFNHGRAFYDELLTHCPNYKMLIKKLKKGEFA
ncbi:MAG: YgjP-like metallopeptidase domain-containing protein [Bacilli bacterium]|jgi:hypothetical protein